MHFLENILYFLGFGPNINIVKDPRYGRNSEVPGEDPYLSGAYAVSYVRGMQQVSKDPGAKPFPKMLSYLKHYTAYERQFCPPAPSLYFVVLGVWGLLSRESIDGGGTPGGYPVHSIRHGRSILLVSPRVGDELPLPLHADVRNVDNSLHHIPKGTTWKRAGSHFLLT